MRQKKGFGMLATLALVAFTVSATAGGAAGASGPIAHTAGLKRCLKKAKQIQDPVKRKRAKKRCRKRFANVPLVRATLTWSNADNPNNTDLDLFVFDASGNRAGNGSDTIPLTTISTDVTGGSGTETFTDLQHPLRSFSYGVCYFTGGSAHVNFTITYVTADGVSHTDSQFPGSKTHFNYPGGPTIPTDYCPTGP